MAVREHMLDYVINATDFSWASAKASHAYGAGRDQKLVRDRKN